MPDKQPTRFSDLISRRDDDVRNASKIPMVLEWSSVTEVQQ